MKDFKGTKGQWKANSADTVYGDDMVMICEVNAENYDSRKANAKLISAAPDLLKTLQDTQQLLEYLINAIPTGKVRDTACDANIIALSVIKKALGI